MVVGDRGWLCVVMGDCHHFLGDCESLVLGDCVVVFLGDCG